MGSDPDRIDPQLIRHLQMIHRAYAGQQQGRHLGFFHHRDNRRQVLLIGVRREPVVHRTATQAVAVGDFNQGHASGVQATGDVFHLLQADLVTLGVHAVAQAHVMHGDFFAAKIHGRLLKRGQVEGRMP